MARRITIDLDPTDDATHGAQQYTLFNGHYDNWCYLPLLAFLSFDRESEQYLCAALLRHGKSVASDGTVGLLSRLLPPKPATGSTAATEGPGKGVPDSTTRDVRPRFDGYAREVWHHAVRRMHGVRCGSRGHCMKPP